MIDPASIAFDRVSLDVSTRSILAVPPLFQCRCAAVPVVQTGYKKGISKRIIVLIIVNK